MTIPNKWGLPDLGLGLGLRPEYYTDLLEGEKDATAYGIDWFEIISENFIGTEGKPLYYLDMVAERFPMVMHGVSLSIGSTDPLDFDYLAQLKALAKRVDAVWMGDHVCWTGVGGLNGHDLLPIPYNEEVLAHLVERIRVVQDFLERPLILENPSTYASFAASDMTEQAFIRRMAIESDCGLLLDVNNIYVSARNHDLDNMWEYLDDVPWEHVVQIHLAGHSDMGTHCIDTHDNHVVGPVWDLYADVHRRAGPIATLLEWDDGWPAFQVVVDELHKAKKVRALAERASKEAADAA